MNSSNDKDSLQRSEPSSFAGNSTSDASDVSQYIARVRRSAAGVLGDSEVGRAVRELCDNHADACRRLNENRSDGATVVAVIGPTGQGKSWLVRQFIRDENTAKKIVSGNNLEEATEKIVWVGTQAPADLDPRSEQFIFCRSEQMVDLGVRYLLLDSPGSTDDRGSIATIAKRALSMSSVLILVVRRDQMRSDAIRELTHASDGSIVIPVINQIRRRDNDLNNDVESFVARMRSVASESRVTSGILVDDFEIQGRSEQAVGSEVVKEIQSRIDDEVAQGLNLDRRRESRFRAMEIRFRESLAATLGDHLPELTTAVRRINDEARRLPIEIAESLVGGGSSLRAVVRARLRLALLTDTSAIWFPYRSMLSLMNLTHGAWDRLLMSLSGSLPSLVSAVYTSSRNLIADRDAQTVLHDGLRRRSAAAVADRLGPLTRQFKNEIRTLQGRSTLRSELGDRDSSVTAVASMNGLETLQEKSHTIFENAIDRYSCPRAIAGVAGLIGTASFWIFMSGPILEMYRQYVQASYSSLTGFSSNLAAYPQTGFSFWINCFLLSILPTAIFAMIVLSWSQRRSRVDAAESMIRKSHHDAIEEMQRSGVLRLTWDEPLLADAEFLLSAGSSEPWIHGGAVR
jgi:hypothetical protein